MIDGNMQRAVKFSGNQADINNKDIDGEDSMNKKNATNLFL